MESKNKPLSTWDLLFLIFNKYGFTVSSVKEAIRLYVGTVACLGFSTGTRYYRLTLECINDPAYTVALINSWRDKAKSLFKSDPLAAAILAAFAQDTENILRRGFVNFHGKRFRLEGELNLMNIREQVPF